MEVVTSHKTLRKQALLSAVKGVLTLFNRKVLNLHKQGSALRKVTPGLHTKVSISNIDVKSLSLLSSGYFFKQGWLKPTKFTY